MSTTKYDHLPEQEKHAALAREEAAIKAEALRYHDKHRMTPAKVAKLTARHVVLALLAAFWLIPILWLGCHILRRGQGAEPLDVLPQGVHA